MKVNLMGKKILPLIIISVLVLISIIALMNPPETSRKGPSNIARMSVETLTINEAPYQLQLQSYGTVKPRTNSKLVSQVSGQIVWVNSQFRDGGVFKSGETLLRIDDRDYQADVKVAEAALLNAQQGLAEEQALSIQAAEDWKRLGNNDTAPDLVLRKPQLMSAQAQVISAKAMLSKAKLNLERTRITAPYDGRILNTQTDIGQVISNNSTLAEIYASDYLEIRLPIANRDLAFIDLPGDGIDDRLEPANNRTVTIQSNIGNQLEWEALLVRTESAIDESSQQLHVIAQINKPYSDSSSSTRALKIGEYVTANISGIYLDNAIIIPNKTIYQGSYVYIVIEGVLYRRDISIDWQNDKLAIISAGLKSGDQLVTTPMGQVSSGTRVKLLNSSQRINSIASPKSPSTKTSNSKELIDGPVSAAGDNRS